MWTLARFLPFLIGKCIPCDDAKWLNYLRLLEIMDFVFAPKVDQEDCTYLESLISDHHLSFQKLYPHTRITPKMHYMIHIPRLMLL